jgi:hypothetical protein
MGILLATHRPFEMPSAVTNKTLAIFHIAINVK